MTDTDKGTTGPGLVGRLHGFGREIATAGAAIAFIGGLTVGLLGGAALSLPRPGAAPILSVAQEPPALERSPLDGPMSQWDVERGRMVRGYHYADPHHWIYTRRFAERFGMPEAWISDELRGVEAVAFRMHLNNSWGCSGPREAARCVADVAPVFELYLDSSTALEWMGDAPREDQGYTRNSVFYLMGLLGEGRLPVPERNFARLSTYDETSAGLAVPVRVNRVAGSGGSVLSEHHTAQLLAYDRVSLQGLTMVAIGFDPYEGRAGSAAEFLFSRAPPEMVEAGRWTDRVPRDPYGTAHRRLEVYHRAFVPRHFMSEAGRIRDRGYAPLLGGLLGGSGQGGAR
jgi:hypothetical protein